MTKSSLDLAAEGLYKHLEELDGDPLKLPKAVQPIALLYTFQAMVDNGGFRYPMENNIPHHPPYSVFSNAYRSIGADNAADALDRAVSLFPFDNPELNADARLAYMDSLDEDSGFEQLSMLVCGDESVWKLMDTYVANHSNDFAPYITQ